MFALVKNETVTNPQTGATSVVEVIKIFAPYTLFEDKNGTQWSPDTLIRWTADQKQDAGIYDVAYQSRPDERFYNIVENAPAHTTVVTHNSVFGLIKLWNDLGRPEDFSKEEREKYNKNHSERIIKFVSLQIQNKIRKHV